MKRQKSGEGSAIGTPQAENGEPATAAHSGIADTNDSTNMNPTWMPPDLSQMQNMGMNFPMMNMMNMGNMGNIGISYDANDERNEQHERHERHEWHESDGWYE